LNDFDQFKYYFQKNGIQDDLLIQIILQLNVMVSLIITKDLVDNYLYSFSILL